MNVEQRLDRIDRAIALGRSQVISAEACGDRFDADIYELRVDRLLSLRFRLLNPPAKP